jgi:hypothetical protein
MKFKCKRKLSTNVSRLCSSDKIPTSTASQIHQYLYVLSRFMGVTNKQGLDWMIAFIDPSFIITRNHNKLR